MTTCPTTSSAGPRFGPRHLAYVKPSSNAARWSWLAPARTRAPPIGVLVFKVADRGVVEDFARADPLRAHGVTTAWRVREWTTVTGRDALTRVTL